MMTSVKRPGISIVFLMIVVHVTSSMFFGGPERQMLGLARSLAGNVRTVLLSFSEGGRCQAFLEQVRLEGFGAHALRNDTPHLRAAVWELIDHVRDLRADILCVHGYKAGLLGRLAARRAQVPVVAVSRGWTYESPRVRFYEFLDRINLQWMDRVVCVSQGQAAKVRRAGVPEHRIIVIPNAIQTDRFDHPDPAARAELEGLFPRPPRSIVGAAGRLSPEKGFSVLVDAAALIARWDSRAGFVLFGDGVLRPALAEQIAARGLSDRFVLAGFRPDLDRFLPSLDLLVQSSYTEGMPNVVLEACAAGVPVVATAVGGTPEILEDGRGGYLVPPGDPEALGRRVRDTLADEPSRRTLGRRGRQSVRERFTFEAQAARYRDLFSTLLAAPCRQRRPSWHRSRRSGPGPEINSDIMK
jgi:glycosyltransferase involved in cell wall biosynthesis